MTYRKDFNEVLTLTCTNNRKPKFSPSTLNNFCVIEDLLITKGTCLKNESTSDAMSIFIVTKRNNPVNIKPEGAEIQERSLLHLVKNQSNEVAMEGQSFLISGVSFTNEFIEETEIMSDFLPYTFSFFSSESSLIWELEPEDTITVKHQIHLLAEHVKNSKTHPYRKEILIHAFFVFLFEIEALRLKQSNTNYFPISRQEIHVHKFKNLVHQQFRQVREIKTYAEQLNVSAKHLTHIVKRTTGRNASEMITEQVIREAKLLLKNPHFSIGEIADKLHFSDQSFFGKYFKRQTGTSPKNYRESVFESKKLLSEKQEV